MKKKLFLIVVLLVVLSCKVEDKNLEAKLNKEISENKTLILSDNNDFDWDSVIILEPYSNLKQTAQSKDIDLSNVSNSIEELDDINLVIFLKDKKAIKSCELSRGKGDFTGYYNRVIPKTKADFKLTTHALE